MFRQTVVLLTLLFLCPTPLLAQDDPTPALSTLSQEPLLEKTTVLDKKFWAVAVSLHTSFIYDNETTFSALRRCSSCYESNPIAAPFVRRGKLTSYAAGTGLQVGVMYLSGKMKGSKNRVAQKVWWLAPVALATGHILAGYSNSKIQQ